jgi:hypothetical protein
VTRDPTGASATRSGCARDGGGRAGAEAHVSPSPDPPADGLTFDDVNAVRDPIDGSTIHSLDSIGR